MRFPIFSFLCLLVAGVASGSAYAADGGNIYRHVAVIGTSAFEKSGLTELVSSELQSAGVELVERQQLGALLHEQILTAALDIDGSDRRIELGRLVKGDVLVLLRDEGGDKDRRVHLIVAECSQGARLSSMFYAMPSGDRPAVGIAHAISADVAATLKRFAGGMKAMVGVTPFIAKNFTYEYHPLQTGYAVLLQDALAALPGVAVVEVEEAEAIGKELQTSGGKTAAVVPVFVEAEFEVTSPANKPAEVRYHITVRTADKSRLVERDGLTLENASRFVSRELAGEVLPDHGNAEQRPFSPDAEFANLVARADAFSALGEWRLAANLRQAALVMRPDDDPQREKLLHDCQLAVKSLRLSPLFRTRTPAWERLAATSLEYYRAELECTEWKIHRYRDHGVGKPVSAGAALDILWMTPSNAAEMAQPIKRDFVLNVFPLTWEAAWNDEKPGERLDHRSAWVDILLSIAFSCNDRPLVREDYDLLLRILNDMVPDQTAPSFRLTSLLWGHSASATATRATPAFAEFLRQLKQSPKPLNRIVAREALLSWQVNHAAQLDPALKEEAEAIRHDFLALDLPAARYQSPGVLEELDFIKEMLAHPELAERRRFAAEQKQDTVGRLLDALPPAQPHRVFAKDPPKVIETGVLKFELLPFAHKEPDGKIIPATTFETGRPSGIEKLIRCTESLDASWDDTAVSFMRTAALIEPALFTPRGKGDFTDVQWDGEHLWVGTRQDGLWLIDTTGKVLAKIGQDQGLPPCDRGVKIQVLGPDRLAIAGSFSPTNRAFLAMLTKNADGYHVNVFHKATGVGERGPSGRNVFDRDLAFLPDQMALCRSRDGGDFLIVSRSFATVGASMHPLIVDLKTLSVSASARELSPSPFLAASNGIFQPTNRAEEYRLWRPTSDGHDLIADLPPLRLPEGRCSPDIGRTNPVWTVGGDGQIYLPGYSWFRVNPQTMTACCMTQDGPAAGWYQHIAPSHAGLVYWGLIGAKQVTMYAVHVDEKAAEKLPVIVPE